MPRNSNFLTIEEASRFASQWLGREVTQSNISYLIQYGRVKKRGTNGKSLVKSEDLKNYYHEEIHLKEKSWKKNLGDDLNWHLSFSEYRESERTKHVHRLHPYKGKFIPQLVEYFLDSHTDEFKKISPFKKGDIVLDPFCGSGTSLVQANELGMHAVGIDVSAFNTLISNVKVRKYNVDKISSVFSNITKKLKEFQSDSADIKFETELAERLKSFNQQYFPSPNYRRAVSQRRINEHLYAEEKIRVFLPVFRTLVKKYNIKITQDRQCNFLDKWYLLPVRKEIDFLFKQIKDIKHADTKRIAAIVLSRTIRSCRATTHADLGTLKEPVSEPYYCKKHGKICRPIFSITGWWERYCQDTCMRLIEFDTVRTDTHQFCLTGDSRTIDIAHALRNKNKALADLLASQKIKGIFSSPPYVGLIDYHEQHAYSYDLLGFTRKDELEIGPLSKGQGREARRSYVEAISQVLNNAKPFLQKDFDIFLVANDKYNLYSQIAEDSELRIINQYKRPVLNRVEKDRSVYSETIFHLKKK